MGINRMNGMAKVSANQNRHKKLKLRLIHFIRGKNREKILVAYLDAILIFTTYHPKDKSLWQEYWQEFKVPECRT